MSRGWKFGQKDLRRNRIRESAIERAKERKRVDGARVEGHCVVCKNTFDYVPSGPGMIRLYCSVKCLNRIGSFHVLPDMRGKGIEDGDSRAVTE